MSSPIVVTFQPSKPFGRDQHREIGLAAGARESRRDVALLARRRRDAEDQHVLGEPALVAAHHRGDAQREALLAEQRVAAVARAVTTRSRASRESGRCTCGPCCTATARPPARRRAARRPSARTGTKAPSLPEHVVHGAPHARHQLHVDDDVRAVGQLDADVRDVAAERAHRERHDVHRAPAHAAVEQAAQRRAHLAPARPSCWSGRRPPRCSLQMNVRSSTRATSDGSEQREIAVRAAAPD